MRFPFSATATQQNVPAPPAKKPESAVPFQLEPDDDRLPGRRHPASVQTETHTSHTAVWRQTFSDWIRRYRSRGADKDALIVGLDVTNGWLTLAWRYANRYTGSLPVLEGVHTVRLPEGMNWATPGCAGQVCKELRLLTERVNILTGNAQIWLRLDEKQDETRQYLIPRIRQSDRDTVAQLTAHKEKPFDEATSLFDYRTGKEITDRGVIRIPVTALVAPEKTVTTLHEQAEAAGLALTGITSTPVSVQNLYASGWLANPWEQFVFVEMGEEFIRILLFSRDGMSRNRTTRPGWNCLAGALQNDSPEQLVTGTSAFSLRPTLVFASDDPYVRDSPTTDSSSARIRAIHSERLFRTDRSPTEESELLAYLDAPLRRLRQKLEETLSYSALETGQPAIQGIVLSAPRYCASLLRTTFETLGLPCRFFRYDGAATPQARMDLEQALPTTPEAHLTRAIGLCLSDSDRTPNLLMTPQKRRVLAQQTQIARLSLLGALLLAMATGLGSVSAYQNLLALRQEKAALQTRLTSGDTPVTPEDVRTAHSVAQQRHADMRRVERRRLAAALVSELAACTPKTITLSRMSCAFQTDLPEQITPSAAPLSRTKSTSARPTADNAVVIIRGTISGDVLQRESRLAEYLNRLGRSPLVLSLQIEKRQENAETISFIATLTLVSI